MARNNVRLARYSATQALQQIMQELYSDSDASADDSGSDYEDHVSEQSEISDEESAVPDHEEPTASSCTFTAPEMERGRGRGRGRCRGRGRGRVVSSGKVLHSDNSSDISVLRGKNNFEWKTDPPAVGRRREQDIMRSMPGLTAAAVANGPVDAFKLFVTHDIISNVVLQTNREARRRIRDWNDRHPSELRQEWTAVTDDEVFAFLGLCILAGAYKSNHEPVTTLWSEREGRPAFTATMSRNRFTDIQFHPVQRLLLLCQNVVDVPFACVGKTKKFRESV